MDVNMLLYAIPLLGVLALIFTYVKSAWVAKQEVGNERMAGIAKAISDGAMAFLRAEYKILAIFVVIVAILLAISGASEENSSALVGLSFIVGAFCSALAGFIGMRVATKANVRTTNAARHGLGNCFYRWFSNGNGRCWSWYFGFRNPVTYLFKYVWF